jgi:predicted nucleic acid-binding protein
MPGARLAPESPAVLDASVAIRFVVPEVGSEAALELFARGNEWRAPRLLLTEVAAALRRKTIAAELTPAFASNAIAALLRTVASGALRLQADEGFAKSALELSLQVGHKLPDCIYLAIAEDQAIGLATADVKLARLAEGRGVAVELLPSA